MIYTHGEEYRISCKKPRKTYKNRDFAKVLLEWEKRGKSWSWSIEKKYKCPTTLKTHILTRYKWMIAEDIIAKQLETENIYYRITWINMDKQRYTKRFPAQRELEARKLYEILKTAEIYADWTIEIHTEEPISFADYLQEIKDRC